MVAAICASSSLPVVHHVQDRSSYTLTIQLVTICELCSDAMITDHDTHVCALDARACAQISDNAHASGLVGTLCTFVCRISTNKDVANAARTRTRDLERLFEKYGECTRFTVTADPSTGRKRRGLTVRVLGYRFVCACFRSKTSELGGFAPSMVLLCKSTQPEPWQHCMRKGTARIWATS
eukprot:1136471-Pelagomonas_calceolata.AAC.4